MRSKTRTDEDPLWCVAEETGRSVSVRDAVEDWLREVYLPTLVVIEWKLVLGGASSRFSHRTLGDLYPLLAEHG